MFFVWLYSNLKIPICCPTLKQNQGQLLNDPKEKQTKFIIGAIQSKVSIKIKENDNIKPISEMSVPEKVR